MSRRNQFIALVAVVLCCTSLFNHHAHAQTGSEANSTGKDSPAKSPADVAFADLGRDMNNLFESLRGKGGIGPEDQSLITALRDRAVAFKAQFPTDVRGSAVLLQIAMWLKDDSQIDAMYEQVLKDFPNNEKARLGYANRLKVQNRYGQIVDVLKGHTGDPAKSPEATSLLSESLFAEQHFQEAVDVLNTIPPSSASNAKNPMNPADQDEQKKTRADYVGFWNAEKELRQKEASADDLPRVVIVTSRGPIIAELFENEAPNTVANFINLADKGFYNGTKFHRVIPNFMAQGGDPNTKAGATGTPGQGTPGYHIADEHTLPNHRLHFTGSLAMANTGVPNSGDCQFFITVTPTAWLNGKHTVFGTVIEGLEVARSLKQDDVIESITVLRRRDHPYVPATIPLPPTAAPSATLPAVGSTITDGAGDVISQPVIQTETVKP